MIRASEAFFLAADGSYSGAVEQIAEERVAREDRKAVRSKLQLTALCEALSEKNRVVELQHKIFGENSADYGRLTAILWMQARTARCIISCWRLRRSTVCSRRRTPSSN